MRPRTENVTASPISCGRLGHRIQASAQSPTTCIGKRRGALSPFFSKRAITDLSSVIQDNVTKFLRRLEESTQQPAPRNVVRMDTAFTALTTDIIAEYSFGHSWKFVDHPDFNPAWKMAMQNAFINLLVFKSFPWYARMVLSLPPSLISKMDPSVKGYLDTAAGVHAQVTQIVNEQSSGGGKDSSDRKTIFHDMRDSSSLPAEEKSVGRLTEEGLVVIGAGTDTTARALSQLTYQLLTTPAVLAKLRAELSSSNLSRPPSPAQLEALPYLSAVVLEAVRLMGSTAIPQARVAPDETLVYKHWRIPPGTEVSELPCLLLHDPDIFPDPDSLVPERWIDLDPKVKQLRTKPLFSTGPRNCVGMNLAYAELYFVIAEMFGRFDLELVETTWEDVRLVHYSEGALARVDSPGVKMRVKGLLSADA